MSGNRMVFVVDDDRAVRDSLKFVLELDGLDVCLCAGGAELLAHPDLRQAGCFVIDYRMPIMDGIDVIGALRAAEIAVPAILITSGDAQSLRRRADGAGVSCVLEKPLLDSALADAVRAALLAPGRHP